MTDDIGLEQAGIQGSLLPRPPIAQPVPAPSSPEEYARIRPLLIDTHGQPLVTIDCGPCGGRHLSVEPCVADIPCPTCASTGPRCRRPSEHDTDAWHAARLKLRTRILDQREYDGQPVPARWPSTS